jgi:hypothetical protein
MRRQCDFLNYSMSSFEAPFASAVASIISPAQIGAPEITLDRLERIELFLS